MRLKSALRRGVAAAVIAGIVVSSGIPAYAKTWNIADGDITWVKMIHDFYGPFHQMVDTAIGTQTDKKSQARILGNDPKTGHIVKARIGRYGPMVEIEGEEGQKGRFASLKKGQLIESITLEEALALFALPLSLIHI